VNLLPGSQDSAGRLIREVDQRVARKMRARSTTRHSVWMGLRLFGLIGWSVVLPVLLGVAAGVWIDAHWPSRVSFTITLLFVGVGAGCYGAWRFVEGEQARIRPEEESNE
jgi:ATP synthase protein I